MTFEPPSHLDNLAPGRISPADDLWPMQYVIRMTFDTILRHPDDIKKLQ